jgi:CDP-glucose 4,6-dehydratase
MEISKDFWKKKKVLITGHTGFKGSWLSLWLQACGADLVGYSVDVPTTPSLFEVARVSDGMVSVSGDVRGLSHIRSVIDGYKPAIVIHMAAQPLVRKSYEDPIETYSTNIMGTINVLEAVRHSDSVRTVLVITSDKCYENQEWFWGYRENDPMGGHDPYSSSKGCAELVVSAYVRSFFRDKSLEKKPIYVATARAGNVIGGGDWAKDRLVPDTMKAILDRQPVFIRYPGSIRPWQHVLEPLRGYLLLLENLWHHGDDFVGAWNFGPDDRDARTVSWIVDRFTSLWGEGASWKTDLKQHPHEATYLKLDCSKAKALLGWSPCLNIDQSLQWVVEWYRGFSRGAAMRGVTLDQIARYEDMIHESHIEGKQYLY